MFAVRNVTSLQLAFTTSFIKKPCKYGSHAQNRHNGCCLQVVPHALQSGDKDHAEGAGASGSDSEQNSTLLKTVLSSFEDEKIHVLRWLPLEGVLVNRDPEEVTKAQQVLVGKLAVLGLGAVVLAERVTGEGAVQALEHNSSTSPLVALFILSLAVAGILQPKPKNVKHKLRVWPIVEKLQSCAGRLACLSLAGLLTAEMTTGQAVLELMNIETGVEELTELEAVASFLVMLLLTGKTNKPA